MISTEPLHSNSYSKEPSHPNCPIGSVEELCCVVLHHCSIYIMDDPEELSKKKLVNHPTFVLQESL